MTPAGRRPSLDAATERRLVIEVPGQAAAVARARQAVANFLAGRGVPSVVVDDMELVTSELVTNAIIHPPEPVDVVRVEVAASDVVSLVVSNVGPAAAIPPIEDWRTPPPHAPSGRGLAIVKRLSDAVSVRQVGDRAVVTCQRRLPDGGPTGPTRPRQ
jgi:anti-sigma regulatory factor (Ser/Thr protein kinase)